MKLTKDVGSITQKTVISSYGWQLLRTASGYRDKKALVKFDTSHLTEINPCALSFTNSNVLGAGKFGECKTATLHNYTVCVKQVNDSKELFLREAYFINKIGVHKNLPYSFGIISSSRSLVMSCHMLKNESLTIYDALHKSNHLIESHEWVKYMIICVQTIGYLHQKNIIHNDIKSDNFIFDMTAHSIEPILIDFGKACYVDQGKFYNLNDAEKKIYQEKHFHVAPVWSTIKLSLQEVTTD